MIYEFSRRPPPALLARRSVVARGNVAHAAIADRKTVNNGKAQRTTALDYPSTHLAG